ncbi:nucleotidyl transferase, partial [Pseudomonas sp. FW305-BF8]
MAPLRGGTLISQGIELVKKEVPNIHITVGYKKAMLAEHVIQQGASSVLNTEGQSNAWWVFHTLLQHLNEPLYVLTCDNVTELD